MRGKYGTISFGMDVPFAVTFRYLCISLWFAFKLDHLCLLHWMQQWSVAFLHGSFNPKWLWCSSFLLIYIVLAFSCSISMFLWMWLFNVSFSLSRHFCLFVSCIGAVFFWFFVLNYGFAVFLIILIWRS